ncbi:hypothetical protein AQUCO_01800078v1 [Aquilegia coerulea]|uniref:KIB1-4 beta-propeller domain-containing protein n=1 Tax=Aquilegia coerulea TaxID=218851 RepID=A0A2G5DJV6_AQUCA|nr:hypothetical protein AQUCO_01800078v1 [Aquilegia coerulea]
MGNRNPCNSNSTSSSSSLLDILASLASEETENEVIMNQHPYPVARRTGPKSFRALLKQQEGQFKKKKTTKRNKAPITVHPINQILLAPIQGNHFTHSQHMSLQTEDDHTDWAGLPVGLVHDISKRLPVLSALSMAAACKSWSYVITDLVPNYHKRGLPWILLSGQNDTKVRTCFSVLENRVMELNIPEAFGKCCWGSIQDWLLIAETIHGELYSFFFNPFSRIKFHLPKVGSLYFKMLLSASPTDPNCVFVLLCKKGTHFVCWTPGVHIWRQEYLGLDAFDDAVFCNGCFYFVNYEYNIRIVDAQTMVSAMKKDLHAKRFTDLRLHFSFYQVAIPERPPRCRLRRYLVESCGEVLLVCRIFGHRDGKILNTRRFEVFKLDACKMVWVKLESLGDRVLFIGKTDSRSLSAKELGINIANCIFFLSDEMGSLHRWTNEWDASRRCSSVDDWGVFSLGSNSFIPDSCYRMDTDLLPPIWITAPIWWYLSHHNPQIHRDANGIVSFFDLFYYFLQLL